MFPKLTAGERDQAGFSEGGILKPAWSHGAPWWPGTLSKSQMFSGRSTKTSREWGGAKFRVNTQLARNLTAAPTGRKRAPNLGDGSRGIVCTECAINLPVPFQARHSDSTL